MSRGHSCPEASSSQPLRVRLQAGVGPHGEGCLHSWILDESMESLSAYGSLWCIFIHLTLSLKPWLRAATSMELAVSPRLNKSSLCCF